MQHALRVTPFALALAACFVAAPAAGVEPDRVLKQSQKRVPARWGTGDERGMTNAIGPGT